MFGRVAGRLAKCFGYQIVRRAGPEIGAQDRLPDLTADILSTIDRVRPYTMTSFERLAALCMGVEYTIANSIPGAFVECGVWKGGSSMAAALTYLRLQREDVELYLFDTFEGMSKPGKEDVRSTTGEAAGYLLKTHSLDSYIWARSPLEEVRENLASTGYPLSRVHFVKGMVETMLPEAAPEQISILRLDTDWYESTRHELIHLFPRLAKRGVLIIDDYGYWAGAKKAVDEYFAGQNMHPLLIRIDDTGRICTKT